MAQLNIDGIIQVFVSASSASVADYGYNTGLIVGPSTVLTKEDRVKKFASLADMAEAGFGASHPEYAAAALYFAQNPRPNAVYIGVKDSADGASETMLDAVKACLNKDSGWYGLYVCAADDATITSVAAWADEHKIAYFYDSKDDKAATADTTDIFSVLQTAKRHNAIGIYSKVDHIAAAAMGYAMGANDGGENSAFTLAYKTLRGVQPDDLTAEQVKQVKAKNGNCYVNRCGKYDMLEQGVCADGTPYDEMAGMHQLAGEIQAEIMGVLNTVRKVPQTDAGTVQLVAAVGNACRAALRRGFLAPGIWTGDGVLTINTGDALTEGFAVLADSVDSQSREDRQKRLAPPIYALVKLSGAMEYAVINVTVDR